MDLVDCPECKSRISGRATACPQCGVSLIPTPLPAPEVAPAPAAAAGLMDGWKIWALILLVCGGGLVFAAIKLVNPPKAPVSSVALDKQKQACAEAMTAAMNLGSVPEHEKAAVEGRVKTRCEGLDIKGQLTRR
jgi:hypothetical protein